MREQKIKMKVVAIDRLRINSDGKGVCSIVHSYGCPLQCRWCSNPITWNGGKGTLLTAKELYEKVKVDNLYFQATGGGMTFCGGEPLVYADFILEFSAYCKENNWKLNVETSLYARKEAIESTMEVTDVFYIDLKVMNGKMHENYTGRSNQLILDNIRYLCEQGYREKIIISFPLIPGVNDGEENITEMCSFMKSLGLQKIQIIPYRTSGLRQYEQLRMNVEEHRFSEVTEENLKRVKRLIGQGLGNNNA